MRRLGFVLSACSASLLAWTTAGIWQTKQFQDWTDRDAQSIILNSPWAKQMPMPAAGRPGVMVIEPGSNGAPPPSASLGNSSNTTTGTNMTVSGYPGSQGPADRNGTHNLPTGQSPSGIANPVGAPEAVGSVTIIWASATPIRLAVLKLRSHGNIITEAQMENAAKPRPNYVIAVAGLPAPDGTWDPKDLARRAFLSVHGKPPVAANESTYRKIGGSDVYFFHFTRASLPITESDGQVEFKMSLGQMELKKRFGLKEMQYQGQLAL